MTSDAAKSPIPKTLDKLRSGDKTTIVAFGDSITEGFDVDRCFVDFWEEWLRGKFPDALLRMINSGRGGDTTFDAVDRLRRDVVAHRPDLVTVEFGINDCFSTVYRSEFRENLQWVITRFLEETSAEVLLVTSPMPASIHDQESLTRYYDVVRFFAAEYGLGLVQLDTAFLRVLRGGGDFSRLVLPDGIHPSEEGCKLIAREFIKLFE